MPPALDRLLASPSALRLLRRVVNGQEVPALANGCRHFHVNLWTERRPKKWRRWEDVEEEIRSRDRIRNFLEEGDPPTPPAVKEKARRARKPDGIPAEKTRSDGSVTWARSLAYRERHHGQRGIMTMWKMRQHRAWPLPTHDSPVAEYLWGTFLKHPDLVTHVIDHAAEIQKQTGKVYPLLYELVMGYWLPRSHAEALAYHRLMLEKLQLKRLPLARLARYGASTFTPAAYDALMEIYWASEERGMYDEIVPVLVEKDEFAMARRWHIVCMHRGDIPSKSVATHPVVQAFMAETAAAEENEPVEKVVLEDSRYDKDLMRRLIGRDTPPVRFEDAFTARMFATRTFLTETVIRGLATVGVNEIGPQAVMAMALRTDPIEDLPRMFDELKASGIALQGCVYSLAIEKFASMQKWHLVRSMLDSDQHPDVFGDAAVQRKLLDYYLDQNDTLQAQRTLAILTLFHKQSSKASWNILLQTHIQRTGPKHVSEVLQNMRTQGVMVNAQSLVAIKSLLRRRQRGHKPSHAEYFYDDVRFVTRVYMTILEFGMGPVPPETWWEIMRRFGMTGRFKESTLR